jgi:hypothetical protein
MTASMQTRTVPTQPVPTGPIAETRHNHPETVAALRAAVTRSAQLWRRAADSGAAVPGLDWTAGETAAHMIGDLHDYTEVLTRYAKGYITHAHREPESPSRLSAQVNARHLAEVPERNLHRLAGQLEDAAATYLALAETVDLGTPLLTPNGLVIDPSTMTALLLGEQLIHGLDIARATDRMWSISARDALKVVPGVLTVAPNYLRPAKAHQRVSFELRMRDGGRYRLAVDHGSAVVSAAGQRADCTITTDSVTFLLVGFGRIPQWSPVLRGKLRPGGRKPWRAMRFGTLLASP